MSRSENKMLSSRNLNDKTNRSRLLHFPKPSCKICFGHLKFDEEINISLSDIKCNLAGFFIDKQNLNPCSVVQCCFNNRIWAISGSAITFCFATSGFAMLCCAMLGPAMLRYACYASLCYA